MAIKDMFSNLWGVGRNKSISATQEAGKSSTAIQGGVVVSQERNQRLQGVNKFRTYENNVANVDIVFASVRFYMSLVAASAWSVEPADESDEAKRIAELTYEIINGMDSPFVDIVKSAALFKFNGFAWLEMTAQKREDGSYGLSSIENRPCKTVVRWDADESGTVFGIGQQMPLSGNIVYIPRWKSIYLVENLLSDSPEGFGYFRSIAETCASLLEIQISEKMGINKDLRGIPVGRAPIAALEGLGMTEEEYKKSLAPLIEFLTLQQKGETTSLLLDSAPYASESSTQTGDAVSFTGNKQYDVELLSSQTNGLGDVDKVIRRKNYEIARSLGTEVLLVGDSSSGSLALSKDKSANLLLSVNGLIGEIADQFNKDLVPFLAKLNNWDKSLFPTLTPSEVSQRTIEDKIAALRDLAPLGIMLDRSDDATKEIFRELDFTPLDESVAEGNLF